MTMIDVLMPALSPTLKKGRIARWLVTEGARVCEGDIIAEVANEHGTMEVEAEYDGLVHSILVPAGESVIEANTPIALLLPAAADVPAGAVVERLDDGESIVRSDVSHADVASPSVTGEQRDDGRLGNARKTQGASVNISMREALREAIAEEMRRDASVLLIGEGVAQQAGAFAVCEGLLEEFGPRRVVEIELAGRGYIGLAVGAAYAGLRPVVQVSSWSNAISGLDQIVNAAAKIPLISGGGLSAPIVLRGPNGASAQVGTRLAQCLASWLAHVPGLKVAAPMTPADAKGLLKAAIRDGGPVVILESEDHYGTDGPVPVDNDVLVPLGKARVVRPGADVTLVSYGRGMVPALAAADRLAEQGVETEVIDLRSLRPLDMTSVVASVERTGRLVSVEEGWPVASIGAEICATVATVSFGRLKAAPLRIAGADEAMPYAECLERRALPSAETVVHRVKELCDG